MPISSDTFLPVESSTRPTSKAKSITKVEQFKGLDFNEQPEHHSLYNTPPHILGKTPFDCNCLFGTSRTGCRPRSPHHKSHSSLSGNQKEQAAAEDPVITPAEYVDAYCPFLQTCDRYSHLGTHSNTAMPDIPPSVHWLGTVPVDGSIVAGRCLLGCSGDYPSTRENDGGIHDLHTSLEFPTLIASGDLAVGTTPFADYIDRMVPVELYDLDENKLNNPNVPEDDMKPIDPSYIKDYRKMAEPLSEWVATYVWGTCFSGGLQRTIGTLCVCFKLYYEFILIIFTLINRKTGGYNRPVPPVLARSTYTLLCSTLLQPSAIMLSLWYIAHLPVNLGDITRGVSVSEYEFRTELLDQNVSELMGEEYSNLETTLSYRVILLGCMLANKWLDDHTFSNKTWYVF